MKLWKEISKRRFHSHIYSRQHFMNAINRSVYFYFFFYLRVRTYAELQKIITKKGQYFVIIYAF